MPESFEYAGEMRPGGKLSPPENEWFSVQGDLDDFIFYYEARRACPQGQAPGEE